MEEKRHRTYLSVLKFEKYLLSGLAGAYFKNIRFTLLFTLGVFLFGFYSFFTIPRNLNPEVNIPIVTVNTAFPGASPTDVESLVTIPLENQIKKVSGLSTYRSSSSENFSLIIAEFERGTEPKRARDEVRSAVEGAILPSDVKKPAVKELDFENIPVWTFALMQKENGEIASLMRISKRIKDVLEKLGEVDRIELSGFENQEIELILKPEIMRSCRVEPALISQTLKSAIVSYPGGTVETENNSFIVNMEKTAKNLADIREIYVTLPCGERYRLGEIAKIAYQPKDNQFLSFVSEKGVKPKPAVKFAVYKTKTSRVDTAVLMVRKSVEKELSPYNDKYKVVSLVDFNEQINNQFDDLTENFLQTLGLVFFTMFIFYGLRQALVASLAIPFPILITFSAMQIWGISLNFISIFSLLIALGLFVDNAVVIIEAYTSYYKTGKFTPLETAILVYRDFKIPLFSINLVTVWAFLPLLIAGGLIGEFIKPLPIIVSVSMFASVLTALAFTLSSMMVLSRFKAPRRLVILIRIILLLFLLLVGYFIIPKTVLFVFTYLVFLAILTLLFFIRKKYLQGLKNSLKKFGKAVKIIRLSKNVMDEGLLSLNFLSSNYRRFLAYIIPRKKVRLKIALLIIFFCLVSYLLLPLGALVNEFFPKTDQGRLYLQIELPSGTSRKKSYQEMLNLFEKVRKIEGVDYILAETGVRFSTGVSLARGGDNLILYTLVLEEKSKRRVSSIEKAREIRKMIASYPEGKAAVLEITGGPPAGADISLSILGEDLKKLNKYADKLVLYLQKIPGVNNPEKSVKETNSRISFEPDRYQLVEHGISESQIGLYLRGYISGQTLVTLRFTDEEEDLIFKVGEELLTPSDLSGVEILTSKGAIPLSELGKLVLKENPQVINREEGKRILTVTAGVLPEYSTTKINRDLLKFAQEKLFLEDNYEIKTGGVNEENAKSVQSIILAMGISAILILVTMVVQLGSFRKAFLVMLVIPLAVSGVFVWFSLTATPLSFPSLIGILALFGVVIANSIVLVDKINQNLEAGFSQEEALIDAGASRIEPIMLTSVSSIVGLIPITLADPLWRGLGGAIIAGLSMSGILMLIFIPIVYLYIFPERERN